MLTRVNDSNIVQGICPTAYAGSLYTGTPRKVTPYAAVVYIQNGIIGTYPYFDGTPQEIAMKIIN